MVCVVRQPAPPARIRAGGRQVAARLRALGGEQLLVDRLSENVEGGGAFLLRGRAYRRVLRHEVENELHPRLLVRRRGLRPHLLAARAEVGHSE